MNNQDFKKIRLPDAPGVYVFKQGKNILYIGKATSLKNRVRSYFAHDLLATRGLLIVDMVVQASTIDIIPTDSVVEALILEAQLIKKHQPRYNTKEKDDKSYCYVIITREDFPRVLIERGKNIHDMMSRGRILKKKFGPFTSGTQLKASLNIVRKIFPFRDVCAAVPYAPPGVVSHDQQRVRTKPCFNYQLGLCPGTCIGRVSKKEYASTIKNIGLFFEGKKKNIIKNVETNMKAFAKNHAFEKAGEAKRSLFALHHIQDVALITSDFFHNNTPAERVFRVEAYDIAHISGTSVVGVMTVVENGRACKNEYRKFKIRGRLIDGKIGVLADDVASLEQVLRRRFAHQEWRSPEVVVVDGSTAQRNRAKKVLQENAITAYLVTVTKNERHAPKFIRGEKNIILAHKNDILLAHSEAHRFALAYHRKLRSKKSLL